MSNLYIVATPIGNLQDITLRAAKILLESKVIVAESTSKAGLLLKYLREVYPDLAAKNRGSTPKIVSMTEDEEGGKIPSILSILKVNDIALISEAGTPLISDPGFKLVREAIKRGIRIIPVPGPTSAIAALTASGLPPDKFIFLGYLPKKDRRREDILENLKKIRTIIPVTAVIFESPHRLVDGLISIQNVFGNIDLVITRELTKVHEEVIRGKVEDALEIFNQKSPKGEFAILF